jgi:hypothetical protein
MDEPYELFNGAGDNEGFDTGNTSNDTQSNRNTIKKIRNKKSKTWDYFEDDGNNINCTVSDCSSKYSRNSVSTSTLNYHLIHRHGIFVQDQVCLK